jgi:hypothetical protein
LEFRSKQKWDTFYAKANLALVAAEHVSGNGMGVFPKIRHSFGDKARMNFQKQDMGGWLVTPDKWLAEKKGLTASNQALEKTKNIDPIL